MITLAGIELPDDLIWVDEMQSWSVDTELKWSLTGALIVETAGKLKGRPITLSGGSDFGWCPRATLESLLALHEQATEMELVYGSRTLSVRFAKDGIEAQPVVQYPQDGAPDDKYIVKLYLIEV